MSFDFDTGSVSFEEVTGLVPAVIQDAVDGTVLMLGHMSKASLGRTLESGRVTFFSRSRGRLWEKGESSGNVLLLKSIAVDCDRDALLLTVSPRGPTCHTGERSCFGTSAGSTGAGRLGAVLAQLDAVIAERDRDRPSDSYTGQLLEAGTIRTAQKVAEEGVETALAAAADPERLIPESADLLYHLLVLWRAAGVSVEAVAVELEARRGGGVRQDHKPSAARSDRSDTF